MFPDPKALVVGVTLAILWSLEAFLPWMPDRSDRVRHGATNLGLGVLNAVVVGTTFTGVTLWITALAAERGFGLLNMVNWPIAVNGLVAVLLIDLWQYVWHRLNHRVPLLWRFHAVHHSDRDMDATSAVRFHTGEILASSVARVGIFPLLGVSVEDVLLYELFVMPVILFHHSNVRFPDAADRVLRAVIVSPSMHRVHHSRERSEHDSNYASIFSFWDRLLGSFSGARNDVVLGLHEGGDRDWRSLPGLLRWPFRPGREDTGP